MKKIILICVFSHEKDFFLWSFPALPLYFFRRRGGAFLLTIMNTVYYFFIFLWWHVFCNRGSVAKDHIEESFFMYDSLFTPIRIHGVTVRNRILFPGMSTKHASPDGRVTERMMRYYEERAKGGAGLITVEASAVSSEGRPFIRGLSLYRDEDVAGLSELTARIHAHGALASVQLMHGGCLALPDVAGHIFLVSPVCGRTPYADSSVLTVKDIRTLVRRFAEAAARAVAAGFDAVELHGAHGYLLAQFFSPLMNRRGDEYGGSLENRMRFPLEVLKAVREAVGETPVLYRMSVVDGLHDGIQMDDSLELAVRLAREGADALHVSVGTRETRHIVAPPSCVPCGWNASLARAVKSAVGSSVPVIVAGRVLDENVACDILDRGDADMVAMGRALIAEPALPRLVREGKASRALRCISCNEGCSSGSARGTGIGCALNPLAGYEGRYEVVAAARKKRVVIIGGGPAGMHAALSAHARGHEVILCDRGERLGGLLHVAKLPPYKEMLGTYADWCAARLEECVHAGGMEIRLSEDMTPEKIQELRPDVVLLATGSVPLWPAFCRESDLFCTAQDILEGRRTLPEHALIVGGGLVGCETADFLLKRGRQACIVEMKDKIAADMEPRTRVFMMERLSRGGVEVWTNSTFLGLDGQGGAMLRHEARGEVTLPPVDAVIVALGYRPERSLYADLLRLGMDVRLTGDCSAVSRIENAVRGGFEAGLSL